MCSILYYLFFILYSFSSWRQAVWLGLFVVFPSHLAFCISRASPLAWVVCRVKVASCQPTDKNATISLPLCLGWHTASTCLLFFILHSFRSCRLVVLLGLFVDLPSHLAFCISTASPLAWVVCRVKVASCQPTDKNATISLPPFAWAGTVQVHV